MIIFSLSLSLSGDFINFGDDQINSWYFYVFVFLNVMSEIEEMYFKIQIFD